MRGVSPLRFLGGVLPFGYLRMDASALFNQYLVSDRALRAIAISLSPARLDARAPPKSLFPQFEQNRVERFLPQHRTPSIVQAPFASAR